MSGSSIIKSLRSRDVTFVTGKSGANSSKQEHANVVKSEFNNIISNFEQKIEALENRLAYIENVPCKCSESVNNKIIEIERLIKTNHEFIENHLNRTVQIYDSCISNTSASNANFKSDFDIDSLRFHISVNDKIANIERTIKEDRLLVEQIFINQMEIVHDRLDIQQQTVKSCEALMELDTSNDSIVQKQFDDIKSKLVKIEESIKIHDKLLHQLSGIIKRHNNTIATHFDLNKAYCNDLVSKSQLYFNELNAPYDARSNDVVMKSIQRTNIGDTHIKAHTDKHHSNNGHAKSTRPVVSETNNNNKCTIRTQAFRVNGRMDYCRLNVYVHNQNRFNNESEICDNIGRALNEFSNDFKSHKFAVSGLKYHPTTLKLTDCSLILMLPKPIHVVKFNRFLSQCGFQTTKS